MTSNEQIRQTVDGLLPDAERFLVASMTYPSTSGNEHDLMLFLEEEFRGLCADVERVPMSDALRSDPDYSSPKSGITYDGRFNLRVRRPGRGGGKTALFNAHTDVVPPSEGMAVPWSPRVDDGVVYGRGACDDKGPLASLYLALMALDALQTDLNGDVVAHLVCEEENGGNGSLAMVRAGAEADGCIVLEPTDGRIFTSIRGAVWFRITFRGKAGHSGQAGQTRSALLMARDAIASLEDYHADLLAHSKGIALFDRYPNPMPITFGHLAAGNWPAAAPNRAILEGVLGLLPNRTKETVCAEMRRALMHGGAGLGPDDFELDFTYRHDSSVVDPKHTLPQRLLKAGKRMEIPLKIDAMTASCDAWFYNNQLGIPTVVYGPGTLAVAHSSGEQISLAQIARTAEVLVAFMRDYCGQPAG
jgi:acetylornithine deacetylase